VFARVIGVIATASALALPSVPAAAKPDVGISPGDGAFQLSQQDLERELDLYASMGFRWYRIDMNWAVIERVQGEYDWSQPDRLVAAAQARGMRVLAVPTYSPAWATRVPAESKAPPSHLGDFTKFVAAAAGRYGPMGVRHWEVWNEPNLDDFWRPAPQPRVYARMLNKASRAIRRADSKAKVIAGTMGPAIDLPGGTDVSPSRFTTLLYKYGAGDSFDAVSVHPSCFPAFPSSPNTEDWNAFQRLPLIHRVLARHGDAGKKVWLTEFGAPTGTSDKSLTERGQARTYAEAIRKLKRWKWAGPLFIYSGRDRGTDPANWFDNLGFLRSDFTPKLAVSTLKRLVRPKSQ